MHTQLMFVLFYRTVFIQLILMFVFITTEPSIAADHEVIFGAAVSEQAFNGSWDQTYDCMPEYRSELKRLFGWAVTMNTGKMNRMHPISREDFFWDDLDIMVDWFEQNEMNLKYHTIVWDRPTVPDWYQNLNQTDSREALEEHVRAIMSRYKGRITMYDVVNEPLHRTYQEDSGEGYMGTGWSREEAIVNIYTWAREEDPDAILMINEYYVLLDNQYYSVLDEYIELINDLRTAGAPIDAIGVQAHMGLITDSIALSDQAITSSLDRLSEETGLPIYITEFDICTPGGSLCPGDPELPFEGFDNWWAYQASTEQRIYELFINHPGVYGVFRWAYFDMNDSKLPSLFDVDFNPRPVFYTLEDILVSVSPPSIMSVTIFPDNGTISVGDTVRIVVTAVDNEAGLIASNAQFNGVSVPLTDNGDGTYSGIYVAASYHQSAQNVEATGITLTGSAGTSDQASSEGSTLVINIPPSIMSVTITPNTGTVSVGDSVHIVVTATNYEAGLDASDALFNGVSVPLTDNNDGTYSGIYVVEEEHQSKVNVEATGITLTGPNGTSDPATSTGSTLSIVINGSYIAHIDIPEEFILYQNSPNPFNPKTIISYRLPSGLTEGISVSIYDISGTLVRHFTPSSFQKGGIQSLTWDGRDTAGGPVASGLYFCRVTVGNQSRTNKMILIR